MDSHRPAPKATCFAFELTLKSEGPNEFVLSELFPQAFGKKRRKVEKSAVRSGGGEARSVQAEQV